MRRLSLCAAVAAVSSATAAQDLPDCASLLSVEEVRETCGVPATLSATRLSDDTCSLAAERDGTASGLSVTVKVLESAEAAQGTVEMGRLAGGAASGQSTPGMGNEVMGQLAETLGIQSPDAPEAETVSEEAAAVRDLPDIGDGGVRYVMDVGGAMGVATHTVVFSSGATVAKLESTVVANRASVCTADGVEVLARRLAGRL
jgi:hypothetical protein